MVDIFKSDLDNKYINFWSDVGTELKINIKGDVQIFYDPIFLNIVIIIYIEKFNYAINFRFPIKFEFLTDKEEMVQKILQSIKLKIYKEVFEMKGE